MSKRTLGYITESTAKSMSFKQAQGQGSVEGSLFVGGSDEPVDIHSISTAIISGYTQFGGFWLYHLLSLELFQVEIT